MLEAIGTILPFGVSVALSPGADHRRHPHAGECEGTGEQGPMFIVGWLVGLAVVGIIVLARRRTGRQRVTTGNRRTGSQSSSSCSVRCCCCWR